MLTDTWWWLWAFSSCAYNLFHENKWNHDFPSWCTMFNFHVFIRKLGRLLDVALPVCFTVDHGWSLRRMEQNAFFQDSRSVWGRGVTCPVGQGTASIVPPAPLLLRNSIRQHRKLIKIAVVSLWKVTAEVGGLELLSLDINLQLLGLISDFPRGQHGQCDRFFLSRDTHYTWMEWASVLVGITAKLDSFGKYS